MFTVKITGAKEMVADLKRMREKAIPYALKNALTTAAFETRSIWQREIRSTFVNRNTYTANSVRVEQASTTKLVAKTGSIADYMDEQEEGATIKGSGKHKAIPTAAAAGQAGGGKRTKLVRGRFYLGAIQVAHPALSGGRRQQNAIAIAVARKKGQKVVLLNRPKGGKALFLMGAGHQAQAQDAHALGRVARLREGEARAHVGALDCSGEAEARAHDAGIVRTADAAVQHWDLALQCSV
jgi:hypothetical protein